MERHWHWHWRWGSAQRKRHCSFDIGTARVARSEKLGLPSKPMPRPSRARQRNWFKTRVFLQLAPGTVGSPR
jgi:hypothetical protein